MGSIVLQRCATDARPPASHPSISTEFHVFQHSGQRTCASTGNCMDRTSSYRQRTVPEDFACILATGQSGTLIRWTTKYDLSLSIELRTLTRRANVSRVTADGTELARFRHTPQRCLCQVNRWRPPWTHTVAIMPD